MLFLYSCFVLLIIIFLVLDLGLFHKKDQPMSVKEAFFWTAVWVVVSLLFNLLVYYIYEHNLFGINQRFGLVMSGSEASLKFLTGYLIEKSLSLDNIFVIALIFSYFKIELKYQHRILFWGIVGALIFRGVMIAGGSYLILKFSWMVYVFGGLLIITAIKLLVSRDEGLDVEHNKLVVLLKEIFPLSYEEKHGFFVRKNKKIFMTVPFLALMVVESSDVVFAIDSIPAIFAITKDPFIVFTSNIFAILGLRSLYFALAAMMDKFKYLKISLVFVLAFVGVKMILSHHYLLPTWVSLVFILVTLLFGAVASVVAVKRDPVLLESKVTEDVSRMARMTFKSAKRLIAIVMGFTVCLIGIAMIFLPGPAIVVLPIGLLILSSEFYWAKSLLRKIRQFDR